MSVERENAVINNQIILRNNFRFSQTSDLFDPYAVSKVEILDSDGSGVLQTFTGIEIIKDSTGKYHVVAAAITIAKTIYDKWYFTPAPGAVEITKPLIMLLRLGYPEAQLLLIALTDATFSIFRLVS
ncbi:MAG: hypothetical protein HZC11_06630 [Nitrospirae bacterium]|nr:hypothetical protein [Nitrospirota bacterium]